MRYTAEEIAEMRRRGEDRTDWGRIDAMTDEERRAARARDPDAVELPEDWPERVVTGVPEPHQEQVTLRLDPDILDWFRQQGPGYQTRINAALRAYMEAHGHRPK